MAAAPVLLDELIEEFLLRLPPSEPETLAHAALVCKPWYGIISAPRFRRRFREFHRGAQMLLGLFSNGLDTRLVPTSSFRLPAARRIRFGPAFDALNLRRTFDASSSRTFDARHGRVLVDSWDDMDERRNFSDPWPGMDMRYLIVWDPATDERWDVDLPPPDQPEVWGFEDWNATVLCAAAASGTCDHRDCHGKPFTIVVVGPGVEANHMSFLHVYSSEADSWSEPIPVPKCCVDEVLTALVGSTLYFSVDCGSRALSYDLATRQISVINLPPKPGECATALMAMENGRLGVARLDEAAKLSLWSMDVKIGWTQIKVIELDKVLPINAHSICSQFLGFAQDVGVFFVGTNDGLFSFDLSSGRARKVFEKPCDKIVDGFPCVVPYVSFYNPVLGSSAKDEEPGIDATRV